MEKVKNTKVEKTPMHPPPTFSINLSILFHLYSLPDLAPLDYLVPDCISYIFCPRQGISHFSKEFWFLLVGNDMYR